MAGTEAGAFPEAVAEGEAESQAEGRAGTYFGSYPAGAERAFGPRIAGVSVAEGSCSRIVSLTPPPLCGP